MLEVAPAYLDAGAALMILRLRKLQISECAGIGAGQKATMSAQESSSPPGAVLQSATRTLRALDALSHYPAGATAKAPSADLGLRLGTTYHLLNTLVAVDYAVQDPISLHFRLGPRTPHLYHAFLDALRPPPGVLTLLQVLQEATAETVYLGRLHGQDVVAIACLAGTRPDAVPAGYIGLGGPAHATVIGQAILATLPPPQLERFLTAADLSGGGPFPATDVPTLRHALAKVHAQGYAIDRGDRSTGLAGCLAAAVSQSDSEVPDAFAVLAPRSRFLHEEPALQAAVTTLATGASALLHTMRAGEDASRPDDASSTLAQAMAMLQPPRRTRDRPFPGPG